MGRRLSYIRPSRSWYNPLTAAWIAATSETDTTILNALNTFEAGLIANSLTTKFNALYPFVGGTSTKHSYNFMNTSTFQLSFLGGWTHSATGALPNGTNAYADTFLTPSVTLTNFNAHLSFYSRTSAINASKVSIGSTNGSYTTSHQLILKFTDGNAYGVINNFIIASAANATSTGWYMTSRTANNSIKLYKNNSLIATTTTTISSAIANTNKIFIGARNEGTGGVSQYDNKQCAFASIGSGLSDAEASTLYTLTQAFQTALGRDVL
jgi:hypothetical protein